VYVPENTVLDISEISDFLSELEPFVQLNRVQVNAIAKKLRVTYCAAGNTPKVAEDGVILVRTGGVALIDDKDQIVEILQPGDFYGIDSALRVVRRGTGFRCLEDSLIYSFGEEQFQQVLQQHSAISEYFRQLTERSLYQRQKQLSRMNTVKVGDVFKPIVIGAGPDTTVYEAVTLMTQKNVSSLLIVKDRKLLGILTDKDLRRRFISERLGYDTPVSEIMSRNPWTVSVDSLLFNALEIMCRRNIHHLPVTDRQGLLAGMITTTDLIHNMQTDPVNLVSDIHRQRTVEGLIAVSHRMRELVVYISEMKLPAYMASRIVTTITDAMTHRLIELNIEENGEPPCLFSWMAFGSQARVEQALNADQDNALLIETEPKDGVESYFEKLANFVCDGLNACGIPYCPGGIMAKNEDHRLSLKGWSRLFGRLLESPTPDAVMHASIYFDARCIYGSHSLFNGLRQDTLAMTRRNDLFLYHLASNAIKVTAPLNFFKNLILDKSKKNGGGLDIKARGLLLISDMVRVYSLDAGISEVNTRERLLALKNNMGQHGSVDPGDCQNLLDAFDFLAQLRWEQQQVDLINYKPTGNVLHPDRISVLQRQQLKDVFAVINNSQQSLRRRYCRDTW
jgi:CBS domain-containing protein